MGFDALRKILPRCESRQVPTIRGQRRILRSTARPQA
jgi:hypothetical protein